MKCKGAAQVALATYHTGAFKRNERYTHEHDLQVTHMHLYMLIWHCNIFLIIIICIYFLCRHIIQRRNIWRSCCACSPCLSLGLVISVSLSMKLLKNSRVGSSFLFTTAIITLTQTVNSKHSYITHTHKLMCECMYRYIYTYIHTYPKRMSPVKQSEGAFNSL